MSLEPVEFVMALEEKYGLDIPDADAESFQTPADVVDYLVNRLSLAQPGACRTQRAFYRLRRALLSIAPLARNSIRPDTSWIQLLPQANWRSVWPRLGKEVGLALPSLDRSTWLWFLLVVASLAAAAPLAFIGAPFSSLLVLAGVVSLLLLLTHRLGSQIPASYSTIGSVADYVSQQVSSPTPSSIPSREEVRQEVHRLIVEVLRVDSPFTDHSRFRDLL